MLRLMLDSHPELAIPGVAEARQDVALLVQAPVERRAVDRHVRVGRADRRDQLAGRTKFL